MSNEKMEDMPPQGNRTVCTLVSVKIKQGSASHIWHEFYGRKIWTVNIKDVKWLTVELADDSDRIISIKRELEQFKTNGNMHNNGTLTLQNLLILKQKQRRFQIPQEQDKVSVTVTPSYLCDIN
jgi:hypothetical protein